MNHPNCRNDHTQPCQTCHRLTHTTVDRLVLDYVTLRTQYPSPQHSKGRQAPRSSRSYGHPAAWASDTARTIADILDATSEALRDHLGHLPPPPRNRAETQVVNHAYQTLTNRIPELCASPGGHDAILEMHDLHQTIRHALGYTPMRQVLPAPCPRCYIVPVFREITTAREDVINCHACGHTIRETEFGLYARILVAEMIAQAEADLTHTT